MVVLDTFKYSANSPTVIISFTFAAMINFSRYMLNIVTRAMWLILSGFIGYCQGKKTKNLIGKIKENVILEDYTSNKESALAL